LIVCELIKYNNIKYEFVKNKIVETYLNIEIIFLIMDTVQNYTIDGRKIRIIYDSNITKGPWEKLKSLNNNLKEFITSQILEFCQNIKIAQYFSKLNFIITTNIQLFSKHQDPSKIAMVGPSSWGIFTGLAKADRTVYINFVAIMGIYSSSTRSTEFKQSLSHELTHLWHMNISQYSKLITIDKRLAKLPITKTKNLKNLLYNMRQIFFEVVSQIVTEGIGEFGGKLYTNQISFTVIDMNKLYLNATKCANELIELLKTWNNSLLEYLTIEEISLKNSKMDKLYETYFKAYDILNTVNKGFGVYDLGLHIIYTILYVDKELDLEQIAKMDYVAIIRKYESCMSNLNLTPVLSYTSRKGMIDYASLIESLNKTYNENKII